MMRMALHALPSSVMAYYFWNYLNDSNVFRLTSIEGNVWYYELGIMFLIGLLSVGFSFVSVFSMTTTLPLGTIYRIASNKLDMVLDVIVSNPKYFWIVEPLINLFTSSIAKKQDDSGRLILHRMFTNQGIWRHYCCLTPQIVHLFVESNKEGVNHCDKFGRTPIHMAIQAKGYKKQDYAKEIYRTLLRAAPPKFLPDIDILFDQNPLFATVLVELYPEIVSYSLLHRLIVDQTTLSQNNPNKLLSHDFMELLIATNPKASKDLFWDTLLCDDESKRPFSSITTNGDDNTNLSHRRSDQIFISALLDVCPEIAKGKTDGQVNDQSLLHYLLVNESLLHYFSIDNFKKLIETEPEAAKAFFSYTILNISKFNFGSNNDNSIGYRRYQLLVDVLLDICPEIAEKNDTFIQPNISFVQYLFVEGLVHLLSIHTFKKLIAVRPEEARDFLWYTIRETSRFRLTNKKKSDIIYHRIQVLIGLLLDNWPELVKNKNDASSVNHNSCSLLQHLFVNDIVHYVSLDNFKKLITTYPEDAKNFFWYSIQNTTTTVRLDDNNSIAFHRYQVLVQHLLEHFSEIAKRNDDTTNTYLPIHHLFLKDSRRVHQLSLDSFQKLIISNPKGAKAFFYDSLREPSKFVLTTVSDHKRKTSITFHRYNLLISLLLTTCPEVATNKFPSTEYSLLQYLFTNDCVHLISPKNIKTLITINPNGAKEFFWEILLETPKDFVWKNDDGCIHYKQFQLFVSALLDVCPEAAKQSKTKTYRTLRPLRQLFDGRMELLTAKNFKKLVFAYPDGAQSFFFDSLRKPAKYLPSFNRTNNGNNDDDDNNNHCSDRYQILVNILLDVCPNIAQTKDEVNMNYLPLHYICDGRGHLFCSTILKKMVSTYPQAANQRDRLGRCPFMILITNGRNTAGNDIPVNVLDTLLEENSNFAHERANFLMFNALPLSFVLMSPMAHDRTPFPTNVILALIKSNPLAAQERILPNDLPLHRVLQLPNVPEEVVRALVKAYPPSLELVSDRALSQNPLHIACRFGVSVGPMKVLIESSPTHVLLARDMYGRLPIHYACLGNEENRAGRRRRRQQQHHQPNLHVLGALVRAAPETLLSTTTLEPEITNPFNIMLVDDYLNNGWTTLEILFHRANPILISTSSDTTTNDDDVIVLPDGTVEFLLGEAIKSGQATVDIFERIFEMFPCDIHKPIVATQEEIHQPSIFDFVGGQRQQQPSLLEFAVEEINNLNNVTICSIVSYFVTHFPMIAPAASRRGNEQEPEESETTKQLLIHNKILSYLIRRRMNTTTEDESSTSSSSSQLQEEPSENNRPVPAAAAANRNEDVDITNILFHILRFDPTVIHHAKINE